MSDSIVDRAESERLLNQLRSASSELYDACVHVGRSFRSSFLRILEASHQGDMLAATGIAASVSESDIVVGQASRFHDLRERAVDIWEQLKPWGKFIAGMVVGLAGFFLAAKLGIVLAAILVVGGFLYAITNGLDAATRQARLP